MRLPRTMFFSGNYEALSPAEVLNPFQKHYRWLSDVYQSVKPPAGTVVNYFGTAWGLRLPN